MQVICAAKSDKKAILRFYKSQRYSARFLGGDSCYLIKRDNKIIAAVIVSTIESTSQQCLLHALVVDSQHRHQGLASILIKHCQSKHAEIVCFCQPDLSRLYTLLGFTMLSKQQLFITLNTHLIERFRRYQLKKPSLNALVFTTQ